MKMNKLAAACSIALLTSTGLAQAEISANIGATSNYVWRGASQTDDGAAISGGIDWAHESGFSLGTWASNVDFGAGGEVEWDIYAGYGMSLTEDVSLDLNIIHYIYPDSDDADFTEVGAAIGFGMFSAGAQYTIQSDIDDGAFGEGDVYVYANATFELPENFSAGVTVGHYAFDDDGDAGVGDLDYTHYQLDIGKSAGDFGDFTFSVSKADEEANGGDDDAKVFVSWAKSF